MLESSCRILADRETIQDLLKLDPFVSGGARPDLPSNRFAFVQTYTGSGTGVDGDEIFFEYSLSASDSLAKTSYTIRTEYFRSGFLSFLGLGVTQDKSTKTTISHTSMAATNSSSSIATTGRFHAAPDQRYAVDAYHDRAFGTFCFVDALPTTAAAASGVMTDAGGKPIANQVVTLMDGSKKISTRTDSQGRYAFFSSRIRPGNFTLRSGAVLKTLSIKAQPFGRPLRLNP